MLSPAAAVPAVPAVLGCSPSSPCAGSQGQLLLRKHHTFPGLRQREGHNQIQKVLNIFNERVWALQRNRGRKENFSEVAPGQPCVYPTRTAWRRSVLCPSGEGGAELGGCVWLKEAACLVKNRFFFFYYCSILPFFQAKRLLLSFADRQDCPRLSHRDGLCF